MVVPMPAAVKKPAKRKKKKGTGLKIFCIVVIVISLLIVLGVAYVLNISKGLNHNELNQGDLGLTEKRIPLRITQTINPSPTLRSSVLTSATMKRRHVPTSL